MAARREARQSPGYDGKPNGTRPRLRRMTSGDCLRGKVRSALIASIRPTSHHSDGVSIAVATRSALLLLLKCSPPSLSPSPPFLPYLASVESAFASFIESAMSEKKS